MKKLLITIFLLIIVSSTFLARPNQAEAKAIPVIVVADIPFKIKEGWLDSLAWAAAKVILHNLTTSLINFIQGGGSAGSQPFFVTDFNQFLRQGADAAAGAVLQELMGPQICSPLRIIIPRVVRRQYSFYLRTQCTLSQIFDAFRNSPQIVYQDFSILGWNGFLQLTEPQNNAFGMYLMSLDEIDRRQALAINARTTEANWGSGFLSVKQCETTYETGQEVCRITTPGKILEDQLSQAFGANLSELALADEINEVIAAAVSRLMTWAFTGGGANNSGLLGFSMERDTSPGGQFYYEPITGQSPLGRELNSIIESNIASEGSYMEFKQNSRNVLRNTISSLILLDAILSGTTTRISQEYIAEIGGPPPSRTISPIGLHLTYLPDTIIGGCRFPVNMSRSDISEQISGLLLQMIRIGGDDGQGGEIGEASSTIRALERLRDGVSTAEDASALSQIAFDYYNRSQSWHDPAAAEEEFNNLSSGQTTILRRLEFCIEGPPVAY